MNREEFFRLSDQTLEELQKKFPTKRVKYRYEEASDWLLATGKKYKDYLAFFRNWLRRSPDDRTPVKTALPTNKYKEEINLDEETRRKNLKYLREVKKKILK